MNFIVVLLSTVVFISCSNRKERIAQIVSEWQDKEIFFPTNSVFTIQGKDTVDYPIESKYKVLVYVDSVGCTSCKLQLNKWNEFITEVDSITNHNIQFLFYLSSKNAREIRNYAIQEDFLCPFCFDPNNNINQLNNFPDQDIFHTFLLDENNKVRIIGNPNKNDRIKKLFIECINKSIN